MTDIEILANDPDYICMKRFGFSLKRLTERYPEGAPNNVIAQALNCTEAEVERRYQSIVQVLKAGVAGEHFSGGPRELHEAVYLEGRSGRVI